MTVMTATVHPFPARMAPELIDQRIASLQPGQVVLDPMMGSGSFVLASARMGLRAVGCDSDPMALLIAEAGASKASADAVLVQARAIVSDRPRSNLDQVIDDAETIEFVDYWFDRATQRSIAGAVTRIRDTDASLQPILLCALSRLIITKDAGLSRARDVSHSRPHVVRTKASFDLFERYLQSVEAVLRRRLFANTPLVGSLHLMRADARLLPLPSNIVDSVMTSPPYLNAIDYLRGHRLSLVWLGHTISDLRSLRSWSVGSERGAALDPSMEAIRDAVVHGNVSAARLRIVNRYLDDLGRVISEIARVLKPAGSATFVVANSTHAGATIDIDGAVRLLASQCGLLWTSVVERTLPGSRRYLPPPTAGESALTQRMRTESVLTFTK